MRVMKFGGSSVANATNILQTISIVETALREEDLLVVVSALGGTTDALIEAATLAQQGNEQYKEKLQAIELRHVDTVKNVLPLVKQSASLSEVKRLCNELESICSGIFLLAEMSPRALDKVVSFGERLSSFIIAESLTARGLAAHLLNSEKLITTNSNFTHAQVIFEKTNAAITSYLQANPAKLYVAAGFIASNENHITTTLGRGGSDYTAAIYAAAIRASSLEIWTDVSGMMTADPRLVTSAKVIPNLSYQEAMELSHFGAKVIYPPTIQPVRDLQIPTRIKNTFAPQDAGTLIIDVASNNPAIVSGISSINKLTLLLLEGSGMVGIPGFSARLFSALARQQVNVILITQSSSEHSICVAIDEANACRAKLAVDTEFSHEIATKKLEPLQVETGLSIVALVGDNMKSHSGISGKMFSALGRNGINIRAIAQGSSEKNISAVISSADVKKAVNVLHEAFYETEYKQVNLFIAGVGNVGARLLAQLAQQKNFLEQQLRLQIRLAGLANSKKMLLQEEGISLSNWQTALQAAPALDLNEWQTFIHQKNLRNSIFVDVTASDSVAALYLPLLRKSVSVVACNKVAAASSFKNYEVLKSTAREFNASFLFETNVGAGLPIISTLGDLMRSGDNVLRMQAVLSGTLNYVFNHYDGNTSFASVVRQAQIEGYTEPDPRLDLSGSDVARKILILAREAGHALEMKDVVINGFLPDACMQGSVDDFYTALEKHETYFQKLYNEAAAKQCKLKFVAQFENGNAAVGLQHIDVAHNLYHLYGKDNVVLFFTDRYREQPLVIKGAGAGADVTASGVFADIIRAAKL